VGGLGIYGFTILGVTLLVFGIGGLYVGTVGGVGLIFGWPQQIIQSFIRQI